ncbi:unnamed protein product [Phytophthora lilii]|uniref:Unnamed protein product n=1 Tax=Phytophthora lilii TaxID=2077276 RepID=A0A9W6WF51_9STRA|nr:unnamed protein product [Phytophthora lilii]
MVDDHAPSDYAQPRDLRPFQAWSPRHKGYCYRRATVETESTLDSITPIEIHRVLSGRWSILYESIISRPISEPTLRQVTEAEAACGIGSFVGGCICVARTTSDGGPSWQYAAVYGYSWNSNAEGGRRQSAHANLGESIFDDPGLTVSQNDESQASRVVVTAPVRHAHKAAESLHDQLSDSDEDEDDVSVTIGRSYLCYPSTRSNTKPPLLPHESANVTLMSLYLLMSAFSHVA